MLLPHAKQHNEYPRNVMTRKRLHDASRGKPKKEKEKRRKNNRRKQNS